MPKLARNLRTLLSAGLLSIGSAQASLACAFHGYTPDPTIVDLLLGSDHVVLAQPNPANPNQYKAISSLLGPLDTVELRMRVDAIAASHFSGNPQDAALIARDGAYGPWVKLAILDSEYRNVIAKVMQRRDAWSLGGDEERYQIFAGLVNSSNPDLQELALRELDRADYTILSEVKLPKISSLYSDLERGDPDLRPIRILLAGLSGDPKFAKTLSHGLDNAVRQNKTYLGAYATGLIELGGTEAVKYIEQRHLTSNALSAETYERLIEAFAIQSQTAPKKTTRQITKSIASMLSLHPDLAAAVARQFGTRGNWDLVDPLKAAVKIAPPSEIADIFAINQYLGIATRSTSASQ